MQVGLSRFGEFVILPMSEFLIGILHCPSSCCKHLNPGVCSYLLTFFFSLFCMGVKQIAEILVLSSIIVSTSASSVASFKQFVHSGGSVVSRVLFLDNLEEGS
jgi:hypothetical protein